MKFLIIAAILTTLAVAALCEYLIDGTFFPAIVGLGGAFIITYTRRRPDA